MAKIDVRPTRIATERLKQAALLYLHCISKCVPGGQAQLLGRTGIWLAWTNDEIEETEEIAASAVRCRLSGIDSTILDEAVNQDYYEQPARILVTMRDTVTGALVANPHEIFYGKMDVLRVLYGKDQSAIEITLESELADFDKAAMKYYSDAQLQWDYSGDLGLRYLAQVMDSRVMWGKGSVS